MRLAVVGTGISGLVCGHLLHGEHDLTLFEAGDHVGGHTLTTRVEEGDREHWVDAGFIVYNEVNYPNFVRLLERLEVETQPTSMSFSVRDDHAGLEYCGTSINTLFAQRRNLLRPSFLRMLADIARFNKDGKALLEGNGWQPTLGEFLARGGYRRELVDQYLVPMTAAIWSTRSGADVRLPGDLHPPLPRQPQPAQRPRAPSLAGHPGRLAPLRRGADPALPRSHPAAHAGRVAAPRALGRRAG